MPVDLNSPDSEVSVPSETPQQENPRTCTRQTPCCKQTCLRCSLPTNGTHVRNLTSALNTTTTTASTTSKPAPPFNHWISDLTNGLQEAALNEDLELLKVFNALSAQKIMSDPDAMQFDLSNLYTARKHALKTINSNTFSNICINALSTHILPDPSLNPG